MRIRPLQFCRVPAFVDICLQLVLLLSRHRGNWSQGIFSAFLEIDGMVEASSRRQHLSFFLFKKLLILPVRFWQVFQLYSPVLLSSYSSHLEELLHCKPQCHTTQMNQPRLNLLQEPRISYLQKPACFGSLYFVGDIYHVTSQTE